jgi:hypothetical protein
VLLWNDGKDPWRTFLLQSVLLCLRSILERALGVARAERKSREGSPLFAAAALSTDAPDSIIRDLIDELIVPRLVDEYLRQYGPGISTKQAGRPIEFRSDGEVKSSP